jgi:hypothetical protein
VRDAPARGLALLALLVRHWTDGHNERAAGKAIR